MNKIQKIFLISAIFVASFMVAFSINFFYDEAVTLQSDSVQTASKENKQSSSEEEATHCGTEGPKSTLFIKEFEIPTPCTQPLGIIVDDRGVVWFTQTNTGNMGMFDPATETFYEYENKDWPNRQSMMWGISYTDDGEIWFTDEAHDLIWKFSVPDKRFTSIQFPTEGNSFPQKIVLDGEKFLINDFTGNKIAIFDHENLDEGKSHYTSIKSPKGFFTGPVVVDKDGNYWIIVWKYQQEAFLVKINPLTFNSTTTMLPDDILAPNGFVVGPKNNLWIADTASSSFFKFDPDSKKTIRYVTNFPPQFSYGNYSGLIKTPISRPYWNAFDDKGRLWFNEQTSNMLAVFDPEKETLIEYVVPSTNPNWADCGDQPDCGVAQVFDFTFNDDKVWFTEWVENNIGVLDTSLPLPVDIEIKPDSVNINRGSKATVELIIVPKTQFLDPVSITANSVNSGIKISGYESYSILNEEGSFELDILVSNDVPSGTYKVIVGAEHPDVTVSRFITVNVK